MYKAAVNIKLSPDYWEALMANPDSDRQAAVSKTMESVGGKLHFFGFTHGKWDALLNTERAAQGTPYLDGIWSYVIGSAHLANGELSKAEIELEKIKPRINE